LFGRAGKKKENKRKERTDHRQADLRLQKRYTPTSTVPVVTNKSRKGGRGREQKEEIEA